MKQFIIFVSALFFCANINSQVYVNEDSQMGIGREPMSDYILTIQRTNSNGLYLWNRGNHDMHIFSMIPNNATYSAKYGIHIQSPAESKSISASRDSVFSDPEPL